jgi:Putative DNA-binding domain
MHPDPVGNGTFAAALQNRDLPPPDGLTRPSGGPATRRFAVYRNNVTVSLVDALAAIYPTLQNLVGEEFFRGMAHAYVRDNLPTSPLMFTYGAGFPAFIESFAPAAHLPFLADVARVERAWLDAFHAADCAPLDPQALAALGERALPTTPFALHPATRLLALFHAAGSIVGRDRSGLPLNGLNPYQPESVLITRPAFDVSVTVLPSGGHAFLSTLIAAKTFAEACDAADEAAPDVDIAALLTLMIATGALAGLDTQGTSS